MLQTLFITRAAIQVNEDIFDHEASPAVHSVDAARMLDLFT
jgi:hypothetical protein